MSANKEPRRPAGRRIAAGVGFWTLSIGLLGGAGYAVGEAFQQGSGTLGVSNAVRAQRHEQQNTDLIIAGVLALGSAAAGAAGARKLHGVYDHIMHTDASWYWETVPRPAVAEPAAQPQAAGTELRPAAAVTASINPGTAPLPQPH